MSSCRSFPSPVSLLLISTFTLIGFDGRVFAACDGFDCRIEATCCTAGPKCCAVSQNCVCSSVCTSSQQRCECHCESGGSGGGGSCGGCHGQICCQGFSGDFVNVALGSLLTGLSKDIGIKITAPKLVRGDTVTVHLHEMPFDDWTQQLARQLGAVAIYRSEKGVVELVPRKALTQERFSENALGGAFETAFVNARVGDAVRSVASSAGVDIVLPESLQGRVTIHLPRSTWQEAIDAILRSTDNPGKAAIDTNGLARIVP